MSFSALGSHSMGADLTYECIGGNQYRIVLSFYRDCEGIDAPSSPYVEINSSCGDYTVVYLTQVEGTGAEVTPTCESVETTCSVAGSPYTGAQEWVYEGIVNLNGNCDEWTFSYSSCCRNSAINTIQDPSNMEVYVESFLDLSTVDCNSSPVFSNAPVPFICVGEQFCFNHGAIDPDGDSLAYELIDPLVASGETVTYLMGYSNTSPVASDTEMTFDEVTGDFCITPSMIQVTVMGVLVKEYRDGELIGTVVRDMQLRTMSCTNSNPFLTGIDGTGNFNMSTCIGDEISFSIPSEEDDIGQQLSLEWNEAIPGASFDPGSGEHPVGQFTWNTAAEGVEPGYYCFTVTVEDDNCPYLGYQTYSFCIEINSIEVTLGEDQQISCTEMVDIQPIVTPDTMAFSTLWSNGLTEDVLNTGPGTYSVEVTTSSGCLVRDTINITTYDSPIANANIGDVCEGSATMFWDQAYTEDGSDIASWYWEIDGNHVSNDTSFGQIISGIGEHEVMMNVTSSNGCEDDTTISFIINPLPEVTFSTIGGCTGDSMDFINATTIAVGEVVSYNWIFDMYGGSSDENPSMLFNVDETISVALLATSDMGCTAIGDGEINVFESPTAMFETGVVCQDDTLVLPNLSVEGASAITSYVWDVEGDIINESDDLEYLFQSGNDVTVTLTVTDENSCVDVYEDEVLISELPEVSFAADDVCEGQLLLFDAIGSVSDNSNLNFTWNINNQVMNDDDISYVFSESGLYPVTLYAETQAGCESFITKNVMVKSTPEADFIFDDSCEDEIISFQDQTTFDEGNLTGWIWDFGNDLLSNQNEDYSFDTEGAYTVSLSVSGSNGCIGTVSHVVNVFDVPDVFFDLSNACEGDEVLLIDQTQTINGDQIVDWLWTMNNTDVSSYDELLIENIGEGTYGIGLTIETSNGCYSHKEQSMEVHPTPNAQFSFAPVCIGDQMAFDQNSTINSGSIVSYQWDFGDLNTSNEEEPTHMYNEFEDYTVGLTVTSDLGCQDFAEELVPVLPKPIPTAIVQDICEDNTAYFIDGSSIVEGSVNQWEWSLNGTVVSNSQNYDQIFDESSVNEVQLRVGSSMGCYDSTTIYFEVHPSPEIDITADLVEGCTPLCVNFEDNTNIANGDIVSMVWDIGNGQLYENETPEYCYEYDGNYSVGVLAESDFGCQSYRNFDSFITVYPSPEGEMEVETNQATIYDAEIDFAATAVNGDIFIWYFGEDSVNAQTTSYLFPDSGHYEVLMKVENEYGCYDIKSDSIYIVPEYSLYFPNAFSPNGDGVNDEWMPIGYAVGEFEMIIFNRWGEVVFRTNQYGVAWNGKDMNSGEDQQIDVYVYKVFVRDDMKKLHSYEGEVTLMR